MQYYARGYLISVLASTPAEARIYAATKIVVLDCEKVHHRRAYTPDFSASVGEVNGACNQSKEPLDPPDNGGSDNVAPGLIGVFLNTLDLHNALNDVIPALVHCIGELSRELRSDSVQPRIT